MITRVVWDVSGTEHEIDWYWWYAGGDWWIEIETVDGDTPDMSEEQEAVVRTVCEEAYPLPRYLDESATDAEYYER